jgi:hypothetical protein
VLFSRFSHGVHCLQLRGIYGVQADGLLALAMGVGPAVITSAMSQEFLK